MKLIYSFLSIAILFSSCYGDSIEKPSDPNGLRPIYSTVGDDLYQEPTVFDDLTNSLMYEELILAIENNVGIHIIDNTDPNNPSNYKLIPIHGIEEIKIAEAIISATAGSSIISIDISDREKAIFKTISFEEDITSDPTNLYPSEYFGLFECVDTSKGLVTSWESVEMIDSDCWK